MASNPLKSTYYAAICGRIYVNRLKSYNNMEYDKEKVDQATLALMWLVTESDKLGSRAWKGFDWATLDRLHGKGLISDPKGKAKSVTLSEEAAELSEALFRKMFGKAG
jgi:hypothetical protein